MSVEFKLVRGGNLLDPDEYIGRVIARTMSMEQLVDHIMLHGSTVCRSDVLSVLEDYHLMLEAMLLDGWNIVTPTANFRLTIRGIFHGRKAEFDPQGNEVAVKVTPGRRLRKAVRGRVTVERQEESIPVPMLVEYDDINSGTVHSTVTPGGQGMITGKLIKFDPTDPQQGIFFVASDNTATRVEVMAWNGVRKHIFAVPDLASGEYRLEVRTRYTEAGDLRAGALPDKLVVP